MELQTFDKKGQSKNRKEGTEWLRLWCENTGNNNLPRVALIGDSITEQVFPIVKRELKGIANVDYLATSYSIISSVYQVSVEEFIKDSDYSVICYNYGLHAFNVSIGDYENAYRFMIIKMIENSKVILSLTTRVFETEYMNKPSDVWDGVIKERNSCVEKLAKEFKVHVNDLYKTSAELGASGKTTDGVHFNDEGIEVLGKNKAQSIKMLLQNRA